MILSKYFKALAILSLLAYLVCFFIYPPFFIAVAILAIMLLAILLAMRCSSKRDRQGRNRYGVIYMIISFLCSLFTVSVITAVSHQGAIIHDNYFIYDIGLFIAIFLLPMTFLLYYRLVLALHSVIRTLPPEPLISDQRPKQGCSIIIATRNEPFEVCKMTFDSAHALEYPNELKEIIIVDNSDLDFAELEQWREYVIAHQVIYGDRCHFIHRNGTEGFKPRNLDIAMEHVSFDHVMLLDADSTLPKHALKAGMQAFDGDKNLGFVTFMLKSTNQDVNIMSRIGAVFQNMIRYLNDFTGHYGYCNFQGHNAIWAKTALDKVCPWLETHRGEVMVTEDIAAAFRSYEAGFYSKPIFIETGEWVPTSLREFESMWIRWSFGGMQVMSKYMRNIVNSDKIGFKVKLDMLYLIFKMAASCFPILAMLCVIFPQKNPWLVTLVCLTLIPSIIFSMGYYRHCSDRQQPWWRNITDTYAAFFVLSSFVSWCCIKAEINYYTRKAQGWKPTSKKREASERWIDIIRHHWGKIIFCLVGISFMIASIITYWHSGHITQYMLYMLPSALFFVNTLLCLMIFGKTN